MFYTITSVTDQDEPSHMMICVRGGPIRPLHRDPQWSIVLPHDDKYRCKGYMTVIYFFRTLLYPLLIVKII
jgi:hypothetical protein